SRRSGWVSTHPYPCLPAAPANCSTNGGILQGSFMTSAARLPDAARQATPEESAMRALVIGSAIGLCLASTLAAEPRQPPLLEVVALWLGANFDLPAAPAMPALVGVSEAQLVEMRYGKAAAVAPGEVVAV